MLRVTSSLERKISRTLRIGNTLKWRWCSAAKSGGRVNVLVLNAGSSSVKYGLFSVASQPAGQEWQPKDSCLLASGINRYANKFLAYFLRYVINRLR